MLVYGVFIAILMPFNPCFYASFHPLITIYIQRNNYGNS